MEMEMISETSLFLLLLSFAKKVIAKVDDLMSKGQFKTIELLYAKPTVNSLGYKEGSVSCSLSYNNFIKKERFIKNQKDFTDKEIKSISEYSEIVANIIKRNTCSEDKAQNIVYHFIRNLEREDSSKISDEKLSEKVHVFISDIDNSPTCWENTVFVNGMWLKEEYYKVTDEIHIRQPQKSDFEKERPVGMPDILSPISPKLFSAVIQFNLFCKSSQENQQSINWLINTLQLFKLGSVAYVAYEFKPKSITRCGALLGSGGKHSTYYKYAINSQDITILKSFICKIMPLVSKNIINDNVNLNIISVAFKRYLDALLHGGTIENRITSAITCLESLYLKGEERMELCHRLSQRVSALLCLLDLDYKALEIYNQLTFAYDIRSTFIHGDQTDEKYRKKLPKLCESVMQYARISLLVFLQLKNTLEKNQIINKLDNSLLDRDAYDKLSKTICESGIIVVCPVG